MCFDLSLSISSKSNQRLLKPNFVSFIFTIQTSFCNKMFDVNYSIPTINIRFHTTALRIETPLLLAAIAPKNQVEAMKIVFERTDSSYIKLPIGKISLYTALCTKPRFIGYNTTLQKEIFDLFNGVYTLQEVQNSFEESLQFIKGRRHEEQQKIVDLFVSIGAKPEKAILHALNACAVKACAKYIDKDALNVFSLMKKYTINPLTMQHFMENFAETEKEQVLFEYLKVPPRLFSKETLVTILRSLSADAIQSVGEFCLSSYSFESRISPITFCCFSVFVKNGSLLYTKYKNDELDDFVLECIRLFSTSESLAEFFENVSRGSLTVFI